MYIYTPLCRYWITLYRYVLVFIVPHVDIELEDNKQFISNILRSLQQNDALNGLQVTVVLEHWIIVRKLYMEHYRMMHIPTCKRLLHVFWIITEWCACWHVGDRFKWHYRLMLNWPWGDRYNRYYGMMLYWPTDDRYNGTFKTGAQAGLQVIVGLIVGFSGSCLALWSPSGGRGSWLLCFVLACGLCTVCHGLLALQLGGIGNLCHSTS